MPYMKKVLKKIMSKYAKLLLQKTEIMPHSERLAVHPFYFLLVGATCCRSWALKRSASVIGRRYPPQILAAVDKYGLANDELCKCTAVPMTRRNTARGPFD